MDPSLCSKVQTGCGFTAPNTAKRKSSSIWSPAFLRREKENAEAGPWKAVQRSGPCINYQACRGLPGLRLSGGAD